MDELVLLGLMALVWLVVVPIVILVKLSGLRGKVREQEDYLQYKIAKLEERLGKLEGGQIAPSKTETIVAAAQPLADETAAAVAPESKIEPELSEEWDYSTAETPPMEITPLAAPSNALLSAPLLQTPPAPSTPDTTPGATPDATQDATPKTAPFRPTFQPPQLPTVSDPLGDAFKLAQQLLRKSNMWVLGGTVLLLCALVFLAKMAIDAGWYNPSLRLASGGLLGVALLAFGWRSRESKPQLGQILQGGGVAAFYLVVIAAVKLHDMLPPIAGLPLLLLLVALASVLAVLQNAPWMAHVSMISGFFAPILMSDGTGNYIALFSIFIVLNAGLMFMFAFRNWGHLCLTGFVLTYGIGGLWGLDAYQPQMWTSVEPFLLAFTACYGWVAWRLNGLIRPRPAWQTANNDVTPGDWATVVFSAPRLHMFFVLATPAVFLIYQLTVVGHLPFAMALSGLGLGFVCLAGAWQTWKRHGQSRPYDAQVYFVLAVTGLNLAMLFGGLDTGVDRAAMLFYLGVTWVVEGGLFIYITRRNPADALARPKFTQALGGALCLIGTGLSVIYAGDIPTGDPTAATWSASVNMHILAGTLLAAVFLLAGAWGCRPASGKTSEPSHPDLSLKSLKNYTPVYPLSFILAGLWLLLGLYAAFAYLEHGLTWSAMSMAVFASGAMLLRARLNWADLRYLLLPPLLFALPALTAVAYSVEQVLFATDLASLIWADPLDSFLYALAPLALFFVPVGLDCLLSRRENSKTRELARLLAPGVAFAIAIACLPSLLHTLLQADVSHNFSDTWFIALPLLLALLTLALLSRSAATSENREISLSPRTRMLARYIASALPLAEGLIWQFNTLFAEAWVAPLPYIPLLNPLDLGAGLTCLVMWFWWQKTVNIHGKNFTRPLPAAPGRAIICAMAFLAGHGVLLRSLAMFVYNDIPVSWIFDKQLAQVCITLYWGVCGFALMFTGARLKTRRLWVCGALLLLVAALKTVFLDTSSAATLAKVAVYFGIGVLFICTGYFIPAPGSHGLKASLAEKKASPDEK